MKSTPGMRRIFGRGSTVHMNSGFNLRKTEEGIRFSDAGELGASFVIPDTYVELVADLVGDSRRQYGERAIGLIRDAATVLHLESAKPLADEPWARRIVKLADEMWEAGEAKPEPSQNTEAASSFRDHARGFTHENPPPRSEPPVAQAEEDSTRCDPLCDGWEIFDGDRGYEIQHCDECKRFESDDQAYAYAQTWASTFDEATQDSEYEWRLTVAVEVAHVVQEGIDYIDCPELLVLESKRRVARTFPELWRAVNAVASSRWELVNPEGGPDA